MELGLDEKTAFVTASSKGLGRAIAKRLVSEGANVAISSRSQENLEAAKSIILEETNGDESQLLLTQSDIGEREQVRDAIESTVERFGGLDIHVNNHGGPPAVTFDSTSDEDWQTAFNNVIMSNVWLSKTALPYLQEGGDGSLITITSVSAREPGENHALSNVFRLGLYGLTKTIAIEYSPEVRANCVTPRSIMTDRVEYKVQRRADHRGISFDEALETRREEHLLDRTGTPPEFADAVAFLASPRGSYVTGEILSVDGGWRDGVI